ncbi:MAG: hypothetical protein AB8B52_08205 [Winogradskyella sp.]|uniref:hypothetical protein n=1 Tax=Winogradskyella sp. TaxID=1883156 RepID=UPI00385BA7D1
MKTRVKAESTNNIYYKLNQLKELTGLSPRMLQYRMSNVKKKYSGRTELLYWEGKGWQIHYSLINEFMPVNKLKSNPISHDNWKCFATWNPHNNYEVEYHYQLIKEIKEQLPEHKIKYAIELDNRGNNHTHFIIDASTSKTKKTVESVINKYFSWYEIIYQVTDINNKFSSMRYIDKAPIKSGIL